MALREIRVLGDEILTKTCREVKEMTPRMKELVDDMLETMYDANGVGLAAPQVGVLRRIVVIDVSEEGNEPLVMVNPRILETDGEQTGDEGCLSYPGKVGEVLRPNYVKVAAFDVDMNEFELEAEEMLARAICHEVDHLDGHMYVEKVIGPIREVTEEDAPEESDKSTRNNRKRERNRGGGKNESERAAV